MESMIKPTLLILIPILNAIGQWLKGEKAVDGTYSKARIKTVDIPLVLLGISILVSIVYGFIVSTFQGWRMVLDAVVITGLLQGSLVAFVSMGVYDTAKKKER